MSMVVITGGSRGHRARCDPHRTWRRGQNEEFEALLAGQTALARVGGPHDVGCMIASLLSDDNRWINARNIEGTGGYII